MKFTIETKSIDDAKSLLKARDMHNFIFQLLVNTRSKHFKTDNITIEKVWEDIHNLASEYNVHPE